MPPSKTGSLGRGLGELIGGIPATIGSAATISSTGFVRLSPDLIGLAPDREARAQEVTSELVESVRVHGILQPILVRRRTQGYEVVVGARRLIAARLAGLKEIPAVIVQATDEEAGELSKVENTCREQAGSLLKEEPSFRDGSVGTPHPAETQEVSQGRAKPPAESGVVPPVAKWARFIAVMILLLVVGVVCGLRLAIWQGNASLGKPVRTQVPFVAAPAVAASVPVVVPPVLLPKTPEIDLSDLKALENDGLTLVIETNDSALVIFNEPLFSSRVALAQAGAVLLKKLGVILVKHEGQWDVEIKGHTDAVPLRGHGAYKDNKELGLARAMDVTRYLMREAQVPAAMLRVATAGEDNPPYPGDDAESARKNRTVTLKVRLCQ